MFNSTAFTLFYPNRSAIPIGMALFYNARIISLTAVSMILELLEPSFRCFSICMVAEQKGTMLLGCHYYIKWIESNSFDVNYQQTKDLLASYR